MKKKKKNKKSSVAKKILVAILEEVLDCAGLYTGNVTFPNICGDTYHHRGYGGERHIKQEISRLKKEKFLEERKRGNRLYLYLTEKGKKAALKHQILNCNIKLKNKYCIVIFDIPESERQMREFFRRFLKESDFSLLQKSVWVTQKDIVKNLTELIRSAGAEKWIHIIIATSISNFPSKNTKKNN